MLLKDVSLNKIKTIVRSNSLIMLKTYMTLLFYKHLEELFQLLIMCARLQFTALFVVI